MATHQGEVLKLILKRKQVDKDALAEALGYNRRTIYHWLKRPELKRTWIDDIEKVLGLDFEALAPGVFPKKNTINATENKYPDTADIWPQIPGTESIYKDKYISATEQLIASQHKVQELMMENERLRNLLAKS